MSVYARLLRTSTLLGNTDRLSATGLDPEAFIRLYDEFFPRVYNYARYRCGDSAVAEDLTAQAFENALGRLADYDPQRAPFGAWLFAIARNLVSNHLRLESRRTLLPLEACVDQPDRTATPEEHLIRVEAQSELLAALQYLSERERDVLSLKFAAGFTNRRIAEITGLSENNVGVVVYRALHRLRLTLNARRANDLA
jgi:RNA polymerase sigma-70 factor (ECF subfamily)